MNSIIGLFTFYSWVLMLPYSDLKAIYPMGEERQPMVITEAPEFGPLLFNSLSDVEKWDLAVEGFSPAYYDKVREAIAINTVEQPTDQWAAATRSFEQPSGVYTIRFTSLLESDGECSYILYVGEKEVMDFQNPRIYGEDIEEYAPHEEVVTDVPLEKGSLIRVEFLPHSNGLVPEGDGFGFARARWKGTIDFIPGAGNYGKK
jgi:hypothetical protein